MIPYSSIASDCRSSLDAESNNVYDDLLDIIPALNKAQDYLLSLITPKLGNKKFNEEALKGIIQTRIFQPSIYSRINVDGTNPSWGLISVVINPTVAIPPAPSTPWTPLHLSDASQSIQVGNYIYVSGGKSARRLNSQEWVSNSGNPLLDGYVPVESNPLNLEYAYLSHIDNLSSIDSSMPYEITIRPFINSGTPVAITLCKYPSRVTAVSGVGSTVDFSPVFQMLLVKATLKFIMEKVGDQTTIYNISEEDINTIIMLQS